MVNNSDLNSKVQTGTIGWMSLIAFFVVTIVAIYIGLLRYQEFVERGELNELNSQITLNENKINELKDQSVEEVYIARKALDEIEASEILWSRVINQLVKETPKGIFYRSYSGNENGDIVLSGLSPTFDLISKTIKVLGNSVNFGQVIVPSVAKGVDGEDKEIVSFSMKLEYSKGNNSKKKVKNNLIN